MSEEKKELNDEIQEEKKEVATTKKEVVSTKKEVAEIAEVKSETEPTEAKEKLEEDIKAEEKPKIEEKPIVEPKAKEKSEIEKKPTEELKSEEKTEIEEKPIEESKSEDCTETKTAEVGEKPTKEHKAEKKLETIENEVDVEEKKITEEPIKEEEFDLNKPTQQEKFDLHKPIQQEEFDLYKPIQQEEFDWDSLEKDQDDYSPEERKQLEDIYLKTMSSISEHEVLDGVIMALNNREVVINIGFKSDAIIPFNEIRYNPDFKVGDSLEVYIENQEDASGQLSLSHKKARVFRSWEMINTAFDNKEIINGTIKSRTKGGLIADVFGIDTFLPGSQIDVKPIRDFDAFVGKTMELKVVKINQEYKNVVVSHKALIEDELEAQRSEIIAKLEKGQVLEGTVKNITSYGVFIDLGGVDGLVHITDLSWGRVNHPQEIVELDQTVKVVILDFDENKKRIALGMKQLTDHPWDTLDKDLAVESKITGKVVVLADYGAFVEVSPGVEGLIHVSEMSWSQHLRSAQDFLKVGDKIEAVILTLDREERKMSMGIKQLIPDPWQDILTKYPINSKNKAIVKNFTNFGVFAELEEGVDGLIHISDLSWSKKIKHPAEFTNINEEIEVVVLEVDIENRRLSLGHKQLEENPWDVFETVFIEDSVHNGTVLKIMDKGALIVLPYGVEGFCPIRFLKKEDETTVKVDDALDFKVIEFSKNSKKIILSHQHTYKEETEKRRKTQVKKSKQAIKKVHDNLRKTTLGDLDALVKLKKDIK